MVGIFVKHCNTHSTNSLNLNGSYKIHNLLNLGGRVVNETPFMIDAK
jgi:hypothetical protein